MEEYKKTHPSTKGDSDMPKKPVSPYILYANAHRAEVKEANPCMIVVSFIIIALSVTEVAKKLGVMWNELDDSEKEVVLWRWMNHCRSTRSSMMN